MEACLVKNFVTENETVTQKDGGSTASQYEKRFIWLKIDKKNLTAQAINWFEQKFFFSTQNTSVLTHTVNTQDSLYFRIQLKGQFAGSYTF